MMLTREEANRKLCPIMSRTTHWNHGDGSHDATFNWEECRGSSCMAWRWEKRLFCLDRGRFLEIGESTTEPRSDMRLTDRGYCGLVGHKEE